MGGILRELRSHGEKDDEGDLKRKRGIYCTALIQIFLFFLRKTEKDVRGGVGRDCKVGYKA